MSNRMFPLLVLISSAFLISCSEGGETASSFLSSDDDSSSSIMVSSSSSSSDKIWEEVASDGDVKIIDVPSEVVIGAANYYRVDLAFTRTIYNSEAIFAVSDSSVLPLEALEYHDEGDGSLDTSGYVSIDATKLKSSGSVFLEIEISSPNNSSLGGIVVCELSIVETPNVTYWDETIEFTGTSAFSKIVLQPQYKVIAQFTDNDHVVGVETPNRLEEENKTYGWFEREITPLLEGEDTVSITFKYAVGHNWTLRVYIENEDGKAVNWYTISDTVSHGSSQSGFNEYDKEDASLTFVDPNFTLELTITDKTYS